MHAAGSTVPTDPPPPPTTTTTTTTTTSTSTTPRRDNYSNANYGLPLSRIVVVHVLDFHWCCEQDLKQQEQQEQQEQTQ